MAAAAPSGQRTPGYRSCRSSVGSCGMRSTRRPSGTPSRKRSSTQRCSESSVMESRAPTPRRRSSSPGFSLHPESVMGSGWTATCHLSTERSPSPPLTRWRCTPTRRRRSRHSKRSTRPGASCPDSRTVKRAALGHRDRLGKRRHSHPAHRFPATAGDLSEEVIRPAGRQPAPAADRRCCLVFVAGHSQRYLVRQYRPVHSRSHPETVLERIHGPHRGLARLTQECGRPPAIAGRITTVSESDAPVSRPSRTRTSSSLR